VVKKPIICLRKPHLVCGLSAGVNSLLRAASGGEGSRTKQPSFHGRRHGCSYRASIYVGFQPECNVGGVHFASFLLFLTHSAKNVVLTFVCSERRKSSGSCLVRIAKQLFALTFQMQPREHRRMSLNHLGTVATYYCNS
jgi:hypothetical protein